MRWFRSWDQKAETNKAPREGTLVALQQSPPLGWTVPAVSGHSPGKFCALKRLRNISLCIKKTFLCRNFLFIIRRMLLYRLLVIVSRPSVSRTHGEIEATNVVPCSVIKTVANQSPGQGYRPES